MKGILHSKKFKNNLNKWLISYFIVIGLFATVVTYSKYISSMQSTDRARAATFDAHITYVNDCSSNNEFTSCDYGEIRPTEKVNLKFKVDPTAMEVNNYFITYIYVNNAFIIDGLYIDGESSPLIKGTDYTVDSANIIKIEETNIVENLSSKIYKLNLRYNYELDDANFNESFTDENIVRIAWSATQID